MIADHRMNAELGQWRSELDFVVPNAAFESFDDIRISTAMQVWERSVDDAAINQFASLDPDGPEGVVFDATLVNMSPGQVAHVTLEAALRSLDMAGLGVVGGAPVEIRLTALPERPTVPPGHAERT